MPKTKYLTAAAVLLAATAAFAASPQHDALQQSRISAAQAVDAAVQKTGGQAKSVDFEHQNGQSYYEVDVLAGGQKHEVKVDAANGSIIGSKSKAYHKNEALPAVSLSRAVQAAVAKTGGQAKEAEWENGHGEGYYQVETVAGGQAFKVKVNGQTGAVISSQVDSEDND